jgi:hypothetical protein
MQISGALSHDEAHRLFTQAMIDDGIIERRRYSPEDESWRAPWYCTWGDQMAISAAALRQDQAGQDKYGAIKAVLTQDFVLRAARLIREEKLNIGTIIIDDGWQDKRGDWNLDTVKFPGMRGLVDELHSMGFNVALWFAPFITEPDAAVVRRPGFTGITPKHKLLSVDYTNPAAREWICEKIERWFSSAPDGWDADGLKLDFLPERIYAETHSSAPEWRGEERCLKKLLEMFDSIIRKHKGRAGLLHVPFNPHFTQYCAALHGEERFDKYLGYMASRPALMESLAPGAWLAPHFNYNPDTVPSFLGEVAKIGGIAQIGTILCPEASSLVDNLHGILGAEKAG